MKILRSFVLLASIWSTSLYAVEQDFTITAVGFDFPNIIFVNTLEDSTESPCSNKKLAILQLDKSQSNMFLTIALAAQAQGKKLTLGVSSSKCISGGADVEFFKIKS